MTVSSQMLRPTRIATACRLRLAVESLEARDQPSAGPIDLGAAAQFSVLGLAGVRIANVGATVAGDVGVSRDGSVYNASGAAITGTVEEYAAGQYAGRGSVGAVVVDPGLMDRADADAVGASAAAAALSPTQSFQSINSALTVTGNGGLNVISVNGSINASLILSGGAGDVFIVNVTGGLNLHCGSTLGLAGGVTANHVIYNFAGNQGSTSAGGNWQGDSELGGEHDGGQDNWFGGKHGLITTGSGTVVSGTLLGPTLGFSVGGVVNGEVIGGQGVWLQAAAVINSVPFTGVQPEASISGTVFDDASRDGVKNPGEVGIAGVTMTLTGIDGLGHAVSLTTTTAADGTYTFTGLSAGTYSLSHAVPQFYENETGLLGTVNGVTDGTATANSIDQIMLKGGDVGVNYDFAEMFIPM